MPIEGQDQPGHGRDHRPDAEQPVIAEAHHQPAVQHVGAHHPGDVEAEEEAVELRPHAVIVDIGERRARHMGKRARVEEPAREPVAQEAPVQDQLGIAEEGVAQPHRGPVLRRQGLAQRQHPGHGDQPEQQLQPEDRRPGPEGQRLPAQKRPEQRRDAHHQHQDRQHAGRAFPPIEVAHHGPGQHRPGAGAGGLHEAPEDHRIRRTRQGAARRADQEADDARQQHRPAPIAVAQRPPEELPQAEPDQEGGEGELDARRRHREDPAQLRHRRQVHVGRDGPEGHQDAQHHDEAELRTAGGGSVLRFGAGGHGGQGPGFYRAAQCLFPGHSPPGGAWLAATRPNPRHSAT